MGKRTGDDARDFSRGADAALREDGGRVNELGLVDLNRNIRPVGHGYRDLVSRWRDILPTESFSLGMAA